VIERVRQGSPPASPSPLHLHLPARVRRCRHAIIVLRAVFVRDRDDKGPAPLEPDGPTGHHFSCDVVVGPERRLISFRFTLRDDYMWVLDRIFPKGPSGRTSVLLRGRAYNRAEAPAFPTMSELLMSVAEVAEASQITMPASPSAHYAT
jgi:hypothetical protein